MMLEDSNVVGFLATSMPEASKQFYCKYLGLPLIEETPFAIVLRSGGTVIRVQKTDQVRPPPYTALGWEVEDLLATVRGLSNSGVKFEIYDGLKQDNLGIWVAPGGAKVAWLKDPDGSLLSLTQTA